MRLHHLEPPKGARRRKIRVGRGDRGRRGGKSGRGTKGTGARGKLPVWFEGGQIPLIRRQPKIRRSPRPSKAHPPEYTVINVARLETAFEDGEEVTPETLRERGLVKKKGPVKVLGQGELTRRLTVVVDAVSRSARDKVLAAGGSVVAEAGGGATTGQATTGGASGARPPAPPSGGEAAAGR